MLADLFISSNQLSINRDAIRIFGLHTAAYCSELLNIYKKALKKKQLYNDGTYFKIDREYVKNQIYLEVDEQLKCDANLVKVNVIKQDAENPDIISFDVEIFASILASEDIKLQEKISDKVKVDNPKAAKGKQRDRVIIALKESIECKNFEVLDALMGWIDSMMADPNRMLSKQQVKMFKDTLDDYCNGDLAKALKIIELATVHSYVDCQWAINIYERDNKPIRYSQPQQPTKYLNISENQKRTTALSDEVF